MSGEAPADVVRRSREAAVDDSLVGRLPERTWRAAPAAEASARSTSFYYAFCILPHPKREAITALWELCRRLDDIVDEPGSGDAREELARWRREIARAYDGEATEPIARGLTPHLRRYPIPRAYFEALIDGVELDLEPARYDRFDDLYQYCYRVASVVGLICVEIFGYRNARARQYAIDLGIGLQLTNILRDVGADARRGRVYLPADDLARFGCSRADVLAERFSPGLRAALAFEATRARDYFARARVELPREDRRGLASAEIMGAIYFELLRQIERADYRVFGRPLAVPRMRKVRIALLTWLHGLR